MKQGSDAKKKQTMDVEGIFAIIGVFGGGFGVVYLFFTTRHRERMALIEKGLSADLFNKGDKTQNALKWGMVLIGVGLGLFAGYLLDAYLGMPEPLPYFAMIGLFGGGAMVAYYKMFKDKS